MTPITVKPNTFEGTWDEALAHGEHWAGRRIRISILGEEKSPGDQVRITSASGAGTFEEVMSLVQSFSPTADEESLLDAVMENRTLRRQLAEERYR